MTIRKAVATTTTMAINGGEKSMGYLDGGDDAWSEVAVMMGMDRVGARAGYGDGAGAAAAAATIFMAFISGMKSWCFEGEVFCGEGGRRFNGLRLTV